MRKERDLLPGVDFQLLQRPFDRGNGGPLSQRQPVAGASGIVRMKNKICRIGVPKRPKLPEQYKLATAACLFDIPIKKYRRRLVAEFVQ